MRLKEECDMESATLKRKIGKLYFLASLLAVIIIILLPYKNMVILHIKKLLICWACGFLGISLRAWVYYGIWKENEKKSLNNKEIIDCYASYFYYGLTITAISSVIYLMFYELFKNMNTLLFIIVSAPLFIYLGLAVDITIGIFSKLKGK